MDEVFLEIEHEVSRRVFASDIIGRLRMLSTRRNLVAVSRTALGAELGEDTADILLGGFSKEVRGELQCIMSLLLKGDVGTGWMDNKSVSEHGYAGAGTPPPWVVTGGADFANASAGGAPRAAGVVVNNGSAARPSGQDQAGSGPGGASSGVGAAGANAGAAAYSSSSSLPPTDAGSAAAGTPPPWVSSQSGGSVGASEGGGGSGAFYAPAAEDNSRAGRPQASNQSTGSTSSDIFADPEAHADSDDGLIWKAFRDEATQEPVCLRHARHASGVHWWPVYHISPELQTKLSAWNDDRVVNFQEPTSIAHWAADTMTGNREVDGVLNILAKIPCPMKHHVLRTIDFSDIAIGRSRAYLIPIGLACGVAAIVSGGFISSCVSPEQTLHRANKDLLGQLRRQQQRRAAAEKQLRAARKALRKRQVNSCVASASAGVANSGEEAARQLHGFCAPLHDGGEQENDLELSRRSRRSNKSASTCSSKGSASCVTGGAPSSTSSRKFRMHLVALGRCGPCFRSSKKTQSEVEDGQEESSPGSDDSCSSSVCSSLSGSSSDWSGSSRSSSGTGSDSDSAVGGNAPAQVIDITRAARCLRRSRSRLVPAEKLLSKQCTKNRRARSTSDFSAAASKHQKGRKNIKNKQDLDLLDCSSPGVQKYDIGLLPVDLDDKNCSARGTKEWTPIQVVPGELFSSGGEEEDKRLFAQDLLASDAVDPNLMDVDRSSEQRCHHGAASTSKKVLAGGGPQDGEQLDDQHHASVSSGRARGDVTSNLLHVGQVDVDGLSASQGAGGSISNGGATQLFPARTGGDSTSGSRGRGDNDHGQKVQELDEDVQPEEKRLGDQEEEGEAERAVEPPYNHPYQEVPYPNTYFDVNEFVAQTQREALQRGPGGGAGSVLVGDVEVGAPVAAGGDSTRIGITDARPGTGPPTSSRADTAELCEGIPTSVSEMARNPNVSFSKRAAFSGHWKLLSCENFTKSARSQVPPRFFGLHIYGDVLQDRVNQQPQQLRFLSQTRLRAEILDRERMLVMSARAVPDVDPPEEQHFDCEYDHDKRADRRDHGLDLEHESALQNSVCDEPMHIADLIDGKDTGAACAVPGQGEDSSSAHQSAIGQESPVSLLASTSSRPGAPPNSLRGERSLLLSGGKWPREKSGFGSEQTEQDTFRRREGVFDNELGSSREQNETWEEDLRGPDSGAPSFSRSRGTAGRGAAGWDRYMDEQPRGDMTASDGSGTSSSGAPSSQEQSSSNGFGRRCVPGAGAFAQERHEVPEEHRQLQQPLSSARKTKAENEKQATTFTPEGSKNRAPTPPRGLSVVAPALPRPQGACASASAPREGDGTSGVEQQETTSDPTSSRPSSSLSKYYNLRGSSDLSQAAGGQDGENEEDLAAREVLDQMYGDEELQLQGGQHGVEAATTSRRVPRRVEHDVRSLCVSEYSEKNAKSDLVAFGPAWDSSRITLRREYIDRENKKGEIETQEYLVITRNGATRRGVRQLLFPYEVITNASSNEEEDLDSEGVPRQLPQEWYVRTNEKFEPLPLGTRKDLPAKIKEQQLSSIGAQQS
ncbi:unnamed protein product [Amoebophrya sp. A120]|nr:unnamed protein product [Amoebophrya sp. A120]|eukprot:GSA120T00017949001.1